MKRAFLLLASVFFVLVASGCSMLAPQYSPSIVNVQKLKDGGNISAKVGVFNAAADLPGANVIAVRAVTMSSPTGSYASYVAEAIRQELALAGKLSAGADVEVSGALLRNELDASGLSTGHGVIEAQFIVKRVGAIRYDKTHRANNEWESSFVGNIAIPNAQLAYPVLVQKLLASLYADSEFIKALQ